MKNGTTILLLLISLHTYATDWTLKKENNHLKIFTAAVENSDYKSLKVECTVAATSAQVIAAFFDFPRHPQWVFNSKSAHLIKAINDSDFIYYSELSLPWPYSNRDVVTHVKISRQSSGVINIDSYSEPAYIPEKAGVVRIKTSTSHLVLTSSGNTTKIDYILQFNPGGDLPAWLTNMFVTKGPYETFNKLPGQLKLPDYQNAHYAFLQ